MALVGSGNDSSKRAGSIVMLLCSYAEWRLQKKRRRNKQARLFLKLPVRMFHSETFARAFTALNPKQCVCARLRRRCRWQKGVRAKADQALVCQHRRAASGNLTDIQDTQSISNDRRSWSRSAHFNLDSLRANSPASLCSSPSFSILIEFHQHHPQTLNVECIRTRSRPTLDKQKPPLLADNTNAYLLV